MINKTDEQYLNLLKEILSDGEELPTRAKVDGEQITALSLFGRTLTFDLTDGFPILSSRKIFFDKIAVELSWFLLGLTNIDYLVERKVHWWDSWVDSNGDVGKLYGQQLRCFSNEERCVDQIRDLIKNIYKVKADLYASERRRLVVTAWNPADFQDLSPNQLYPCHGLITQFDVRGDKLSCVTHQRSADAYFGLPNNISSYALFLAVIAHLTGLKPHRLTYNIGDAHIYSNTIDQCKIQLEREVHSPPQLKISKEFTDINKIDAKYFKLLGYKHSGLLKSGKVAI